VAGPLDLLDAAERAIVRRSKPPIGSDTMKATLTDERFDDPAWIYERKLDGIRCLAVRDNGAVRLLSRNDLSLTKRYPEVADTLAAAPTKRFAVDGEIVAFDSSGETNFAKLSARGQRFVPVFLYVFDVLWLDGQDVRGLPLLTRKRLLRKAVTYENAVRLTPHRNTKGIELFHYACARGWEGVIAKRADSTYTASRSRDWLKFKCEHGQELVIGGFTDPHGSRAQFGALLVGYYDRNKDLQYAGKVGTGFDDELLQRLGKQLKALEQPTPPFKDAQAIKERHVHWVKPQLVGQIGFSEWTKAGRLRHPRFQGLRIDKPADEVVREG
jgi:DNA ligase D-like protein (predicted ligase)